MLGKLEEIHKKYLELEKQINDPDAMSDMKRYIQLSKDHKELQPIVAAYKNYRNVMTSLDAAKDMLEKEKDEELRAYVKEELNELTNQRNQMEESIRLMLIPEDPQDRKNAVIEIRAGTGGDEASRPRGNAGSHHRDAGRASRFDPVQHYQGNHRNALPASR